MSVSDARLYVLAYGNDTVYCVAPDLSRAVDAWREARGRDCTDEPDTIERVDDAAIVWTIDAPS